MHPLGAINPDGIGVVHQYVEHHIALPLALHLHVAGEYSIRCGLAWLVERALRDVVLRAVEVETQRVPLRGGDCFRVVSQAALADVDIVSRCCVNGGVVEEEEEGGEKEGAGVRRKHVVCVCCLDLFIIIVGWFLWMKRRLSCWVLLYAPYVSIKGRLE